MSTLFCPKDSAFPEIFRKNTGNYPTIPTSEGQIQFLLLENSLEKTQPQKRSHWKRYNEAYSSNVPQTSNNATAQLTEEPARFIDDHLPRCFCCCCCCCWSLQLSVVCTLLIFTVKSCNNRNKNLPKSHKKVFLPQKVYKCQKAEQSTRKTVRFFFCVRRGVGVLLVSIF